jgi:two-component system cell cycle sensor histidine kinase/response regulator CckA
VSTEHAHLVLVVDDEAPIREVQRRILEAEGYRVIEASGGAEGFAMLQDGKSLDLLIADLDMPDVGGEEMVRRIRALRPDLKVLYVTGYIDRLMDVRQVLWEGEAFLDKPFTAQGLVEAVSLLVHGRLLPRRSRVNWPAM